MGSTREVRSGTGHFITNDGSINNAVADPNNNAGQLMPPTVRLGSRAPNGLPTTGFLFSIIGGPNGTNSTPGVGGFTVTLWLWNPVVQRWMSFQAVTGVVLDALYETYDVDGGCEIFVSVSNIAAVGSLCFFFLEQ